MKARQVGLVLALLVGVALAGLVLRVVSEASAPSTLAGIFPVAEEVVDQVLIQSAQGEARLVKSDGEWRIGIHKAFELRLASLWSIAELLRQSQLVAEEPVHHERLGVDDRNAVRVSFYKGESPVEELLIGHWSPQAGLAYVRRPVDEAVFSMPVNLPGIFEANANAWRNPVVVELQPEEITSVTLMYPDGRIALEREDAGWAVVTPDGRDAGDPARVQALLQFFAPLLTDGFPTDRETRGGELRGAGRGHRNHQHRRPALRRDLPGAAGRRLLLREAGRREHGVRLQQGLGRRTAEGPGGLSPLTRGLRR